MTEGESDGVLGYLTDAQISDVLQRQIWGVAEAFSRYAPAAQEERSPSHVVVLDAGPNRYDYCLDGGPDLAALPQIPLGLDAPGPLSDDGASDPLHRSGLLRSLFALALPVTLLSALLPVLHRMTRLP